MATTKEAICVCLDVGVSMKSQITGVNSDGEQEETTYFKRAVKLFTKFIERKVFSESKDEVCVVLFGTDETNNKLAVDTAGQYRHITSLCRLRTPSFEMIEAVNEISPSDDAEGDFLDAVVVGLDLLHRCALGKKFARQRVFLFSAFLSQFDADKDGVKEIRDTLLNVNAELSVIGLDNMATESENNHNHMTSTPSSSAGPSSSGRNSDMLSRNSKLLSNTQKKAIETLKLIHEQVEGTFYSFSDVTAVLQFFVNRETKVTAWNVNLEIGSLAIPVSRFIKVKETKLKTWKKLGATDDEDASDDVKTTRTHYVIASESDAPKEKLEEDGNQQVLKGEEVEVDVDSLVKGYRYGSTIIPVSEADEEAMKVTDNSKCLRVVGFAKREQICLSEVVGEGCWVVVPAEGNQTAERALSAIIQACLSQNRVIIARYSYNKVSNPRLVALLPTVEQDMTNGGQDFEYLVGVQLPFADDLRMFVLPSFDQISVSQLKPTDSQLDVMDQLVSSTRLDSDELQQYELYEPGEMFNPTLQRTYQCLSHKRICPEDELPPVDQSILDCLKPHPSVTLAAAASIEDMKSKFDTKVVQKTKPSSGQNLFLDKSAENRKGQVEGDGDVSASKYTRLENVTSLKDVTVDDGSRVLNISSKTPAEDFKSLLDSTEASCSDASSVDYTEDCKRCEGKILEFITNSFSDEFFHKAHQLLLAYRSEAIKRGFVSAFNSFLISLRDMLKTKRKENFLNLLTSAKTTLISESECDVSNISVAEAAAFCEGQPVNSSSMNKSEANAEVTDENYDDASDLLALLD